MEEIIFKLRENVDVYKIGNDIIYFYFINKREGINLKVNENILNFIKNIDGKRSTKVILEKIKIEYDEGLNKFLEYLLKKGIIYIPTNDQDIKEYEERYSRQLTFFQEYFEVDQYKLQDKILNEKFLIFGIGAIGSGIAIELAMMGVRNFILVDKGKIKFSSKQRHYYFKNNDIGRNKVEALKDYLLKINSNINIEIFNEKINYDTDLIKYFDLKPTFVVNTLDEPYIGITSLKIGREAYRKNLPMYVGGGFDGHLMSTGELIIPNITPCVDCYIKYFTEKLKNWKPTYNKEGIDNVEEGIFEVGGLPSMSLFSISYGVIEIIKFLANNKYNGKGRGELLFENMKIDYLKVEKNRNCMICGEKNEV